MSNATEPVPCYGDSVLPEGHPLREQAEVAYREGFLAGTREASQWLRPDIEVIEFVEEQRRIARDNARVEQDGAEWYMPGHEILAAQLRGRHHALSFVEQAWCRPEVERRDFTVEIDRWLTLVERWAAKPIDFSEPPRPDDDWDAPPDPKPELEPAKKPGNLEWLRTGTKPVIAPTKSEPEEPSDILPRLTLAQLVADYPHLREPLIHGLLRKGETMNVIAASKARKSWLVSDLALSVATGRTWLDTFPCEQGRVLIVDNELHRETSADRLPKIMQARGVTMAECGNRIEVVNLRGRLKDIYSLGRQFDTIRPGEFQVIVLDAFYRFMPRDTDENDNGTMAQVYNVLDAFAAKLQCAFVLIHHSTKGNQSGKAVTDVGAGAGAQSRAADTHLVLRPHEESGVAVLDAAVRSWPPIEPKCLRWSWPVWTVEESLDPADLKSEKPRRKPKPSVQPEPAKPPKPEWTVASFVAAFVTDTPAMTARIVHRATEADVPEPLAKKLLKQAEAAGLVHRWTFGANQPVQFATRPQSEEE
ncbi:MAG: AAA family ATPase [Gemmataceae bacterium]